MSKAIVVLSGGQDSATCLFWAKTCFDEVHAITFDYGQRHSVEIEAAKTIAALGDAKSHVVVDIRTSLGQLAESALTRHEREVNTNGGHNHLPSTFTPNRNMAFLSLAASWAVSLGVSDLVTGVCQTDFSGYPDCRREFIDKVEDAVRVGNDLARFTIHTPLMWITKAESVRLARRLPGCWLALAHSVTCYHGRKCGECPACRLRKQGFEEAGERDPAE